MQRLSALLPVRYSFLVACFFGGLLALFSLVGFGVGFLAFLVFAGLVAVGLHDLRQTRRAVLRNYPVIGHLRFLLEFIRPEIRQYFIESDSEAAPFSRAQRSLVYRRAKGDQDNQPFGTHLDVSRQGYEWINHSMRPSKVASHDFRVWIGGTPETASLSRLPCTQPYAASVFNISAMSFGALSANAILALNSGAKRGGFAHDTGEGSISAHHRTHGGDLIWEIGSGYFGCRNDDGSFSPERFEANARDPQVKMIELKLSQGAKPGHGGILPGSKVTWEIAAARGVPQGDGRDCRRARSARGCGLHFPGLAQRVFHPNRDDVFHRPVAHPVGRQTDRLQALHRPPLGMVCHGQGHAGHRHHARLHRGGRR